MDFNLLRSWLDLPPGFWPPDHYTLLGLTPGFYDTAHIESRVLERMDRLRGHQLLQPELVTEGMNRLAQALITLTDTQSQTAYDKELQVPARSRDEPAAGTAFPGPLHPKSRPEEPVVVAMPVFDDDIFSDDAQTGEVIDATEATRIIEWSPDVRAPEVTTARGAYEVIVDDEEAAAPPRSKSAAPEQRGRPLSLDAGEPGIALSAEAGAQVLDSAALATATQWLTTRRRLYARLAQIRRARRAWDALGPILGSPEDPVDQPLRLLLLLEAVAAVRPCLTELGDLVGGVGRPGGIVSAIVRQPLVLDTFRRLLPGQRTTVAIDWKQGQQQLAWEYARLRQLVEQSRERRASARSGLAFVKWLADSPEVLLVVLAGIVFFIALLRAATGR